MITQVTWYSHVKTLEIGLTDRIGVCSTLYPPTFMQADIHMTGTREMAGLLRIRAQTPCIRGWSYLYDVSV